MTTQSAISTKNNLNAGTMEDASSSRSASTASITRPYTPIFSREIPPYVRKIESHAHWAAIRETIPEGSLFFTKGKGLFNHLISCRSPVSHVGMLLKYGERVFGLDSTSGGSRGGVDLFNFSSLLNPMKGDVYILPLLHPKHVVESFHRDAELYCHIPYEKKKWRLASFYFGMSPKNTDNSIFCSELIVRMFNRAYGTSFVAHLFHPKHLFYTCPPIGHIMATLLDEA